MTNSDLKDPLLPTMTSRHREAQSGIIIKLLLMHPADILQELQVERMAYVC